MTARQEVQDSSGAVVPVEDVREHVAWLMNQHPPRSYNAFADGWQAALDRVDDWLDMKAEEA